MRVTLRGAEQWHPERWTLSPVPCDQCLVDGFFAKDACALRATATSMWCRLYQCRSCNTYWEVEERRMTTIDEERAELLRVADSLSAAELKVRLALPEFPAQIVGSVEGEWERAEDGRILLPTMPQQAMLHSSIRQVWYVELLTVLADLLAHRAPAPSGQPYVFHWYSGTEPINGMRVTRDGYGTTLDVPLDTLWLAENVRLDQPDLTFADDNRLTAAVGIMTKYHSGRGPQEITSTAV